MNHSEVKRSRTSRYAGMFAAIGTEPRLRILQILMTAEPIGMIVGEIQRELGIPHSTLSHHLDKLKTKELVAARRAGTCLWYRANLQTVKELLGFLYAECCTRNRVIAAHEITGARKQIARKKGKRT